MSAHAVGARPRMISKQVGSRRSDLRLPVWHVAAIIISAIFLIPLASMIVGSLRMPGLPPPRVVEWLPRPLTWSNYTQVFQVVDLGRYIVNTVVVEGIGVPVTLLVSSWAGFA